MKKILLALSFAFLGMSAQSIAQPILMQNFVGTATPGLPTGWTNTTTAITGSPAMGWRTTTQTTNLYFSTVSNLAPHTEYVVCNERADSGNNPSKLTSPTFSLIGATAPYLSYDYVYNQVYYASPYASEQAWVEISSDGGSTWNFLDSMVYITTGDWTNHTVSLSAYTSSSTCQIRFIYKDNGRRLMGAALGNINVFNSVANDMALTTVLPLPNTPTDYFMTSTSATFTGIIRNMGTSAISSCIVSYSIDGGVAVNTTISTSIASLATYSFTCTPYTVPTIGTHTVSMWVTAVGDPYLSNDSMNTSIVGVPFMPTKKILFEEGTGTWCGWCVRGIVYMDSLEMLHPGAISEVAVHNSDPMVVSAYDTWMGGLISGYPAIVVDRTVVDDPQNMITIYNAHNADFGFADITMSATYSGGTVSVPLTVNAAVSLPGDNRLILVLTEDHVHGKDTTTTGAAYWDQHDYYSNAFTGGSAYYGQMNIGGSAGYNFVTLPYPVPYSTMYYNHVGRSATPSVTGTSGLPGALAVGTPYTHTFTAPVTLTGGVYTYHPGWMPLNMHAVLMLVNGSSGDVLNSQNAPVLFALGISNLSAGISNFSLSPNPASNEVNVLLELENNTNVKLDIIDMSGKVVYSAPSQEVTSGKQIMTISTVNFATGVYNVRIETNTGIVTERLSVLK